MIFSSYLIMQSLQVIYLTCYLLTTNQVNGIPFFNNNNKKILFTSLKNKNIISSIIRGGSSTILSSSSTATTSETNEKNELKSIISSNQPTSSSSSLSDGNNKISKEAEGNDGDEMITSIDVKKRNGHYETLNITKIYQRLHNLSKDLNANYINVTSLTYKISRGTYPNMTTNEIDILSSETAAALTTQHPDYGTLASRICISSLHKNTLPKFSKAITALSQNGNGFISSKLTAIVHKYKNEIDNVINENNDYTLSYFGFKTLERSYLLRDEISGSIVERPQYMLMRVALGIHCTKNTTTTIIKEEEERNNLKQAFETYNLMSKGYFIHATPTLFYSGTVHPQLSSCFLIQMLEDSIVGIYDTLKSCAQISKSAGGIGLSISNIRARGTYIAGTRGISNGLVPMLRVFDVTSRYVDQGGGKRPGAFAMYLEPWHADVIDVLMLKKNHGKEEQRARNLFYGLWIPDLFMKRVENDEMWSLMCPHLCPGLHLAYGKKFEELYTQYEKEGKYVKQIKARDLWNAILESQIETGTPYMLYKDACNDKSNQKNLGTIQCSNLCTEIVQFTSEDETAVCNLASICLPKFIVSNRGPYGSPTVNTTAYFDHEALHKVTKIVTRNLNKIIDINHYPTPSAKKSNQRHRPIGIGVSGLADAFIRLGLPFCSKDSKELNEAIFETMYHAALEASAELAEEQGTYETFQGSPASEGILQFQMWGHEDKDTPSHKKRSRGNSTSTTTFDKINHYGSLLPPSSAEVGYNWSFLRENIIQKGLRNSLLIAPMPTASTSQILSVNECFEPYTSNLYLRRVKAGEFIMPNPHLLQDLTDLNLWNSTIRNMLMKDGGSVNINLPLYLPTKIQTLYKTAWELKMKDIIDMAADRGKFIDQSQSLNLFISDPTMEKLTAMHFYAYKKGLKTGMYYLRTRPAVDAIQYTVQEDNDKDDGVDSTCITSGGYSNSTDNNEEICISCQG